MPTSEYIPSVQQVANKIRSRTRNQYGDLVGTFDATTEPTATMVTAIANDIVTEIADVIGDDIPAALRDDAQNVVAIRAAMQIELDYFSDQVNTGRSIYPQLKDLYDAALKGLSSAVISAEAGDGTNPDGSGAAMRPQYSFPEPGITLDTRW